MKVRYTPRARGDLETILRYLSLHSPEGMLNLKRALENTERLISHYPRSGRISQVADTRVLPAGRYPYLVYWTIQADELGSCTSVMDGENRGEASTRVARMSEATSGSGASSKAAPRGSRMSLCSGGLRAPYPATELHVFAR
jgi:plasmid stabilization system protein ParE